MTNSDYKIDTMYALVTCFNPDHGTLGELILNIQSEVSAVVLLNNGGLISASLSTSIDRSKIVVLEMGSNVGVAAALNVGFALAEKKKISFVIMFDQDSTPAAGMITALRKAYVLFSKRNAPIAALGPSAKDPRAEVDVWYPFIKFGKFWHTKTLGPTDQATFEVAHLITSGSLVSVSAWKEFPFDERLFIDLVDFNWCWRIARRGYIVAATKNAVLEHRISDDKNKRLIGVVALSTYNPIRRYYITRNAMYHIIYEPISWAQKIYLFRGILNSMLSAMVADPQRFKSCLFSACGLLHGLFKRLGPLNL